MYHVKKAIGSLLLLALSVGASAQVKKTPVVKKPIVKKSVTKPKKVPLGKYELPGTQIKITTDSGVIVVRLFDETPLHRDNFVKLVKQGFYDSLLFHRTIREFMIQGGDPESKRIGPGAMLGNGGSDLPRIFAEINPKLYHKRGVLAAARDGNPEKASSGCQFYIVQGKKLTDQEIDINETQNGRKYSITERMVYKTIGGTPWLDGNYTVFGEVVSGIEVVDKIANVPCDGNNRPIGDIRMKMEILRMK